VRRLRFLRVALPALLIPFLVLVVLELQRRPKPLGPVDFGVEAKRAASGIVVDDREGDFQRLYMEAANYLGDDEEGRSRFEDVERLLLGRENASPLEIRADRADVRGSPGERVIRLEGDIEVADDDAGYRVSLSGMEVDEGLGEARSVGEVRFETRGYRGTAAGLTHGLQGQPSVLTGLELRGDDGGSIRADRAVYLDEGDRIELLGGVRIDRDHHVVEAPRMMMYRDPDDGALRRVEAFEDVSGIGAPPDREPYAFRSREMFCEWDDDGEPERAMLEGDATVQQGDAGLAAETIHLRRRRDGLPGWEMDASGGTFGRGLLSGALHSLQSGFLRAIADSEGQLESGFAEEAVRFDGGGTTAQAARAEFLRREGTEELILLARGEERARIAGDRQRVAADRIVTRPGGAYLRAEGKVESTLLPAPDGDRGVAGSLFEPTRAVHFVARRMESSEDGSVLAFHGAVRGWQGERNLAGDDVTFRPEADRMQARGKVSVRVPRIAEVAVAAGDFLTVTSQELDYDGSAHRAEFRQDVRVRQQEGWLEAARLEVELEETGGGARVIRAFEDVRLEFRSPTEGGGTEPVSGSADRAEFLPAEKTVRLFGDEARASVRRQGEDEVTTFGRVLRYRVDTGAVEVESGDRDRAKIRTSGPS
jgi:lipopolysaccharide transport protein LptA